MNIRVCSHCGSENDLTRVFCAECGTRLPEATVESSGPTVGSKPVVGSAPALPRQIGKPSSQASGQGFFGFLFSQLFASALLAALLAALIQMAREPDMIPPRSGESSAPAQDILPMLRDLSASTHPASWMINQKAINAFLETAVQMKSPDSAEALLGAKFQRAFVRLGTGSADLGIEQSFFSHNVYLLLEFQPEPSPQGLGAKIIGGAIGRLPVPPVLLPYFVRLFQPTISGLDQSLDPVRRAKSASINPGDVTLQWAGAGTPAR